MIDKEIFIKRLKKLLEENSLTQKNLAQELNRSESVLSKYLNGSDKSFPDAETLCNISNFFGVSTDWLLGQSDNRRIGDSISARDICKAIMAYSDIPYLNFHTIQIEKEEWCVDADGYDEQPEAENRKNTYNAFYFSERFEYGVNDNPYEPNRCRLPEEINGFIKAFLAIKPLYIEGRIDETMYNDFIESQLNKVSCEPLSVSRSFVKL